MKITRQKYLGQMLIEIVVAIGIIAVVLVGVSDLMTRSTKVVNFQKQKAEALTIVQKILNQYRNERDLNPQNFYDTASDYFLDPCEQGKPYKCTVIMQKGPDSVLVTVTASWDDGGQTFKVSLSQSLTKTVK